MGAPSAGEAPAAPDWGRLVEAAPYGLVLVDAAGRVRWANPMAALWLAPTGTPLLGRAFLALFEPSTAARLEAAARSPAGDAGVPAPLPGEALDARGLPFPVEVTLVRSGRPPNPLLGAWIRDARAPAGGRGGSRDRSGAAAYSLPELLMADRLRELV